MLLKSVMNLIPADQENVTINDEHVVVLYLDQEQENMPLDKSAVELFKEGPLIKATEKEAIKI
jgi:hypothetical protein